MRSDSRYWIRVAGGALIAATLGWIVHTVYRNALRPASAATTRRKATLDREPFAASATPAAANPAYVAVEAAARAAAVRARAESDGSSRVLAQFARRQRSF